MVKNFFFQNKNKKISKRTKKKKKNSPYIGQNVWGKWQLRPRCLLVWEGSEWDKVFRPSWAITLLYLYIYFRARAKRGHDRSDFHQFFMFFGGSDRKFPFFPSLAPNVAPYLRFISSPKFSQSFPLQILSLTCLFFGFHLYFWPSNYDTLSHNLKGVRQSQQKNEVFYLGK